MRACLVIGGIALAPLWLAGAANADVGWGPAWFPITRGVWMKHTLSPGRTVGLRANGHTVSWTVKFVAQSNSAFRTLEGTIPLKAPKSCKEFGVYVQRDLHRGDRGRFLRLGRDRHSSYDPPARAELGAVHDRLRTSDAPGVPRPPRPVSSNAAGCENVRSTCVERDLSEGIPVWSKPPVLSHKAVPDGYLRSARAQKQQVPCEQVDRHIDRCIERVRRAEVAYTEGLERYEKSLSCVAVAFATRAEDGDAIELEVLSADGKSWGNVRAEIDERIDVSAWAYAPLTVIADIPIMAIHNTALGFLYVIAVFH